MAYHDKPALTWALSQMRPIPGRPDLNYRTIVREAIKAAGRGVQVIVFPEMAVPGYLIGDRWKSNSFARDVAAYNERIVAELAEYDIVVIFGTLGISEELTNEDGTVRKYNAAFVAQRGRLIGNRAGLPYAIKSLLPNYRIFNDARYFHCLRKLALERGVTLEELLQPFDVIIDGHTYSFGVMLCEDMWDIDYVQKPALILKENGAEILVNLSMSNWSWRKNAKRHQVVRDIIAQVGVPFVYVNGAGCQNNGKNFIPFDGSSTVYGENGDVVFLVDMYREGTFDVALTVGLPAIDIPEREDVDELLQGIVASTLGFWRATNPRHRRKVILGLSGGIDSMLTAAFIHYLEQSGLIDIDELVLVNMPYEDYNSDETKMIAALGARNMKRTLREMPITDEVNAAAKRHGIKRGSGQHKTLQASIRFQILTRIAAQEGGLIICNANKTEIAFGYGTLIADLRGYFAPWMDCVKGEVYQLAEFFNRVIFQSEMIPEACIDIAPTDGLSKTDGGSTEDPFDFGRMVKVDGQYTLVNGYHDAMVRSLVELRKGADWFLEQYLAGTLEERMLLEPGRIDAALVRLYQGDAVVLAMSPLERFVHDLETKLSWFDAAIHKRVQSVPGAHFSRSSFGWDFWESMPEVANDTGEPLEPYYPLRYHELKAEHGLAA